MSHHNGATVSDVRLGGGGTLRRSEGRGPAGWKERGRQRPAARTVDAQATR